MQSRVLLVEDEPNMRNRCKQIVSEHPQLELAGTADRFELAKSMIARNIKTYDLLLTDLQLGDGDGSDLIRIWRKAGGKKAMVISIFGDVESVIRAVKAGADGYLLKSGSNYEMQTAITAVLEGHAPISAAVAGHLLRELRSDEEVNGAISPEDPCLTKRETQILAELARGNTYKEVADNICISPHTVADHVKAIYRKMQVNSRGEAVYRGLREGIIDL